MTTPTLETLTVALAVAYLTTSAVLTLATIGRPRRPFGLRLSLALAATRLILAVGLTLALLEVTA